MLRVTIHDAPGVLTFQVEGRLVGPWVLEAEGCWQHALASQPSSVLRIDLTGVTTIDDAGKSFLAAVHASGAKLIASGCMMRAIVAQITKTDFPDCRCR